jgi:hypothetical protein
MLSKRSACQLGIAFITVVSVTLGRIPDAGADVNKPVGVLVQNPSTGNDCLAGTCQAHAPVPFGGSLSIPYTATRTFPNGDQFQIDGVISISENGNGTSLPGTMSVKITFNGGGGVGGTSQGAPDLFVLHNYLDYTSNGNSNVLTVTEIGSFSTGVGPGSNVTASAQYCGVTNSTVLGPFSPPPNTFTATTTQVVPACTSELLVDTTYTINFQAGTTPGSFIQVGNISVPSLVGTHDFNGDGKSDILFRNSSSGAVVAWQMNGNFVSGSTTIATVPANWHIVANATSTVTARPTCSGATATPAPSRFG